MFADVVEHALKSAVTARSPAKRFTVWKLTGLLERSIGNCESAPASCARCGVVSGGRIEHAQKLAVADCSKSI